METRIRWLISLSILLSACASGPATAPEVQGTQDQATAPTGQVSDQDPQAQQQTRKQTEEESKAQVQADIETILTQPLDSAEYGEAPRCLATTSYDRVEALNDSLVVFHGRGGNVWVNELKSRCLGLKPNQIFEITLTGNRVCTLDRFRGLDRIGGIGAATATCMLGRFQPISEEQLEAIKMALEGG